MKIRFLVHTVTSERDVNGNCYHYSVITSTATGKSLTIKHAGGPDNARHYLRELLDLREGIHSTEEVVKKRVWQRRAKAREELGFFEHELTADALLALERD